MIDAARDDGFDSINADLIYGLPRQTLARLRGDARPGDRASPDRIALYSYAHVPHLFKPQRQIDAELPTPEAKLEILATRHVGSPTPDLLHRHGPFREAGRRARGRAAPAEAAPQFPGLLDPADCDLLAFGISGDRQGRRTTCRT